MPLVLRLVVPRRSAPTRTEAVPDLDAQIAWFRSAYPGGFDDPAWRRDVRGEATPRRNPRGVARASAELAVLVAALPTRRREAGDEAALGDLANALRRARLPLLRALDELPRATEASAGAGPWLDALTGLLGAAPGELAARFDTWVTAQARPSWPAATAVPALCAPSTQLFVRPTVLDAQAVALGVSTGRAPRPTGEAYAALLGLGRSLAQELGARGAAPADLLDVALFARRALLGARPHAD